MNSTNLSTETENGTVQDFANKWGLSYAEASGFIKGLEKAGAAKHGGTVKKAGKGKPSTTWEVNKEFTLAI